MSATLKDNRLKQRISPSEKFVPPLVLLLVVLLGWSIRSTYYPQLIAVEGCSPIAWVYQQSDPKLYPGDYPSCHARYSRSLISYLYLVGYQWFSIPPEILVQCILLLEMALLASAAFFLFRTLVPRDGPWGATIFSMLILAGTARSPSLARWAAPYYNGQFYNISDGLRLFGICFLIRDRWAPGAIALALAFCCHATIGLAGILFVLGTILVPGVRLPQNTRDWLGVGIAFLVLLSWVGSSFSISEVVGEKFPVDTWYHFTRATNFHWYPFSNGLWEGVSSRQHVLPLITYGMLVVSLCEKHFFSELGKRVLGGMGVIAVCVGAGLFFSVFLLSPSLVKLALHRNTDLLIYFSLPFLVSSLLAWVRKSPILAFPAVLILCFPLLADRRYPGFGFVLSTSFLALTLYFDRDRLRFRVWILLAFTALFVGMSLKAGIPIMDPTLPVSFDPYLVKVWLGVAVGVAILARFRSKLAIITLSLVCAFFAGTWFQGDMTPESSVLAQARDFRQIQDWASQHSAVDSLFMVDPALSYGWRDYSRRSSLGSGREWAMVGWMYNSDFRSFKTGMDRIQALGVDVTEFVRPPYSLTSGSELVSALSKAYNQLEEPGLRDLALRFGVDFFVFDKGARTGELGLAVTVFENGSFLVVRAPEPAGFMGAVEKKNLGSE